MPATEAERVPQTSRHFSASQVLDASNSQHPPVPGIINSNGVLPSTPTSRSFSMSSANSAQAQAPDSTVMNETLSVIQEHITDLNTPRHSVTADRRGNNNDSSSEYSSHLDHRLSYIHGEETDEEEVIHQKKEVESWNPGQVADYLASVGVEPKHCDVFREQEISGDVLLGMDQTSVFLKEFELGSVGKRLKTWQRIKNLQDEVNGKLSNSKRRTLQAYANEHGAEDNGSKNQSGPTAAVFPRIPSLIGTPPSTESFAPSQNGRQSQQTIVRGTTPSPVIPNPAGQDSGRRPSAASVRDLHHSRQNSASGISTLGASFRDNISTSVGDSPKSSTQDVSHKKQASFDRDWTMGSQILRPSRPISVIRPVSAAGPKTFMPSADQMSLGGQGTGEVDRGYFSGGEVEGRNRNVLRKKGSTSHSRNSSYTDEQRVRSATTNARHSRFGSVDSLRDPQVSATQKYYGLSLGNRRTPSADTISSRPLPPPKDLSSPAAANMDNAFGSAMDSANSPTINRSSTWFSNGTPATGFSSDTRAVSDSVSGHNKSATDDMTSPTTIESFQTPSRTDSSTTSGGPSFELDSNQAKSSGAVTNASTPASKSSKKKSKKETSAYTQGLEKKTPKEQMVDCDYSGWMKKKSTNLMTTWKPRLFILKGCRLSYYYSEDDTEEKGLIDISFHRVLPADNDRLTGLHATLTGATSSPTSPQNAQTPTMSSVEAESQAVLGKASGDQMFIFKLVPPKPGFSRVNFTKPTVHYFAVPGIAVGRLWMAALMKATIDRDENLPMVSTYQQKTISLAKARALRSRPPAFLNPDGQEDGELAKTQSVETDRSGLNIQGIVFDQESNEGDSGVSGIDKLDLRAAQELPPIPHEIDINQQAA